MLLSFVAIPFDLYHKGSETINKLNWGSFVRRCVRGFCQIEYPFRTLNCRHGLYNVYALLAVGGRLFIEMTVDNNRAFLGSVEGEIAFFRSIMRARPIGIHRHFHMLTIQRSILKDTGRLVQINDIWDKLRSCYNMDVLETIVRDLISRGV